MTAVLPSPRQPLDQPYAEWHESDHGAIVATYKFCFGQPLTFYNTGDYAPNGYKKDETTSRGATLTVGCRESTGELSESPCTTGVVERACSRSSSSSARSPVSRSTT